MREKLEQNKLKELTNLTRQPIKIHGLMHTQTLKVPTIMMVNIPLLNKELSMLKKKTNKPLQLKPTSTFKKLGTKTLVLYSLKEDHKCFIKIQEWLIPLLEKL